VSTQRRIFYVFAAVLLLNIAILAMWYATPWPQLGFPLWLKRYWGFLAFPIYGLLVGVVVQHHYLVWTVVLTILLAVTGGFVHWTAGQLGVAVDWTTPGGAVAGAVLTFVGYVPFSLLGAFFGRFAFQRLARGKPETAVH
jgi:hypothetical protein